MTIGFQGLIFETEVEPEEKFFQSGLEKFWKQVSQRNIMWYLDNKSWFIPWTHIIWLMSRDVLGINWFEVLSLIQFLVFWQLDTCWVGLSIWATTCNTYLCTWCLLFSQWSYLPVPSCLYNSPQKRFVMVGIRWLRT